MGPRTPGLESTDDLPGEPGPGPLAPGPGEPGTVARAAGEAPHVLAADSFAFLSPADRPGDLGRLGPYQVVKLLGEGGMGFVFRAEDDSLHRTVALKVMRPEVAAEPTARERFLREGRAAAAIKSDHVITIYQVSEANGIPFLAMEHLEGQNLEDWLKDWQQQQQGLVPAEEVIRVAKDMLRGLAAAHDKGLVHRDIKPANLWIEAGTNRVKILDFGLTRGGGAVTELTRTGQVLGTVTYMAPEQARGKKVDARADLFSAGVVLHRMLGGQSPFKRDTYEATIIAVAMDEAPPAGSYGVLPAELSELIDRMLSKGPDGRPASASAALAVVQGMEQRLRAAAEAKERAESERIWKENERLRQAQADTDRVERMELWKRSGMPRAWVLKHLDGWGPDDWTALVSGLKSSPYWPLKADEIGTHLERLRDELRAERDRQRDLERRQEAERKRQEEEARQKAEEEARQKDPLHPARKRSAGDKVTLKLPGDVKMSFAWCPPGTFMMGSEHPEAVKLDYCKHERPVHRVNLTKGFYMGTHPVTRGQFAAFVAATNHRTEAEIGGGGYKWDGKWVLDPSVTWKTPGFTQTDDHPVTVVSWNDAQAFSAWLQKVLKRPSGLPSEAEWEYACRAGTTTEFHFGDVINPDLANYDGNYTWNGSLKGKYRQATTAVGSFKPNPWGLFDMHGNVWEWCQDWYGPYSAGDQRDAIQLTKQSNECRVLRGGGWSNSPGNLPRGVSLQERARVPLQQLRLSVRFPPGLSLPTDRPRQGSHSISRWLSVAPPPASRQRRQPLPASGLPTATAINPQTGICSLENDGDG